MLICALVLAGRSAHAVQKTTSTGVPLRWFGKYPIVTIYPNIVFSNPEAGDHARQVAAVVSAANTWTTTGSANIGFKIGNNQALVATDTTKCDQYSVIGTKLTTNPELTRWLKYVQEHNIAGFISTDGNATTYLCGDPTTGQIISADTIFYNNLFRFATQDQPTGNTLDLETAALHELGHTVGLDHSDNGAPVMKARYSFGKASIQRVLTPDDQQSLVDIYGLRLEDCNGLDDDGNGIIDDIPICWSYTERFVDVCTSAHWSSTNGVCFPGQKATQGCNMCAKLMPNMGCGQQDATCWERDHVDFYTYKAKPPVGNFVELFHCFENGANFYSTQGCQTYGDPSSLGFIGLAPFGQAQKPFYVCEWTPPGWIREWFITFNQPDECVKYGGKLVGPQPWGYVRPYP